MLVRINNRNLSTTVHFWVFAREHSDAGNLPQISGSTNSGSRNETQYEDPLSPLRVESPKLLH
jgi:hypothetical protein